MPSSRLSERGGPASAPPPRGTPPGTAARNGANALRAEKREDASPQRPRPSPSGRGPTASASLRIRRFTAAGEWTASAPRTRPGVSGGDTIFADAETAGGNGVGIYPVASQVRRNPESRAPGQTGRACRSWVRRTLRRNAPQAGLPGHGPHAEAPPSVSDVRGVMMRVPRGCEGTRSRPSCGIISERVLAGAKEPPEKTTSPMTHGRVPPGTEEPAWRRASHSISASRRCGGTQTAPDGRTGRVSLAVRMSLLQAGARDGAARVPRGCGGPSERPMSLRRRTLRPEESRSRKSPVSGGKGGAFSERPVSWGAARGRPQQTFFWGAPAFFMGPPGRPRRRLRRKGRLVMVPGGIAVRPRGADVAGPPAAMPPAVC